MAINLTDLQALVKKAAQPMDPGSQAMALAAQAAKPPGGMPIPKPVEGQDPAGEALTAEQQAMEQEKLEEQRRSELEKKDKEIQALQGDLQKEQVERERAAAQAEIAQQAQKAQQALQAEKDKLAQQKTLAQAGEIQHKAQLEKETAEQQVTIAQEKAKALMDIAKQNAQSYVKTTDDARKKADEYYESRQAQLASQQPGFSPALQTQMSGAINALHNVGKLRAKMHALPSPGTPPVMKVASTTETPMTELPKPPTAQPIKPVAPIKTSNIANQSSSTSVPQPGAPPKRTAMDDDFDKSMAQARQQYGNRLYQQYMGGATTAGQSAVGAAQMENAIAEAEGKGDSTQANYLRQQLAMAQRTNEWANGKLQQKADAGDLEAKKQLAQLGDLNYKKEQNTWYGSALNTVMQANPATWAIKGIESLTGIEAPRIGNWSATGYHPEKVSQLDQIRNQYKNQQEQKNSTLNQWRQKSWYDPRLWAAKTVGAGDIVGNVALGWTKGIDDSLDNWAQARDMAARRGVDMNWFGANSGNSAMVNDMNLAAEQNGLSTNPWSHLGSTAANVGEGALTIGATIATGGAATPFLAGAKAGVGALRAGKALNTAYQVGKTGFNASRAARAARMAANPGIMPQWTQSAGVRIPASIGAYTATDALNTNGNYYMPDAAVQTGYADPSLYNYDGSFAKSGSTLFRKLASMVSIPDPKPAGIKPVKTVKPIDMENTEAVPIPDISAPLAAPQVKVAAQGMRGSMNTAQTWNRGYDHTSMHSPGMVDPYDNTMGKAMKFLSPWVQSATGGMIQLVRDNRVPYNSHPKINSDMMQANFLNTRTDSRLQRPEFRSPLHEGMYAQRSNMVPIGTRDFNTIGMGAAPGAIIGQ